MSDSGSEVGDRDLGHSHDRELEDDEERGHRRQSEHLREGEVGEVSLDSLERTECCAACLSKNRNNGRSCICQVPAKQRRAPLGLLSILLL